MLSWLAGKIMAFNLRRLNAGDIRPVLAMDNPDVTLRFPGTSTWAGEYAGKPRVRQWLERFAALGLQINADEVVAAGWPWRSTICVRGTDHLRGPDGVVVYVNRYVIWGHLRWGRLVDYEVYEDTEQAAALDTWIAEHRPELVRPV